MGQKSSDWLSFQRLFYFKILIYFLKANAKFINHGPKKLGLVNLFYILFFFYDPWQSYVLKWRKWKMWRKKKWNEIEEEKEKKNPKPIVLKITHNIKLKSRFT